MTEHRTLGVVLAGGLSRRLGGGDKGLRDVGGLPVLRRIIDRLGPQVDGLIINANGNARRFATFGLPVIADDLPDYPGPLAGILAGLDHAAQLDLPWIVTVPTDVPFLPPDLVRQLHMVREAAPMAMAGSGPRTHPVVALWPTTMRDELRQAVVAGLRKVGIAAAGAAVARWPDQPVDPFFNVNTADDLQVADALAATP